jgi:hypothetical protein
MWALVVYSLCTWAAPLALLINCYLLFKKKFGYFKACIFWSSVTIYWADVSTYNWQTVMEKILLAFLFDNTILPVVKTIGFA